MYITVREQATPRRFTIFLPFEPAKQADTFEAISLDGGKRF